MMTSIRTGAIVNTLGRLIVIEGLLMLLPLGACLVWGESDWRGFAIASVAALLTGGAGMLATRRSSGAVRPREGFVITALVWAVFGLFGLVPFMLSDLPLDFTDSMFEIISGFTTTGATMISDVDSQSHGILLWRALSQWIGGLGIILFILAVVPEYNKAAGVSMFNAEATGISHTKLHPRIRQTAMSLWGVYSGITLLSVVLLWAGPMSLFDSVCQTFAAVATGGFTTHNAGIGFWHSNYVYAVLTAVMFIGGLNFMLLYDVFRRGVGVVAGSDVFRLFSITVLALYAAYLAAGIADEGIDAGVERLVVYPLFHIVSAITSTGFSVAGVETWGPFAVMTTIMMMLCGACTGSTTGGIKIDRILALYRNFKNELRKIVFPKRTYLVRLDGVALGEGQMSRVSAFFTLYLLTVCVSSAVITVFGYSFTDSLFMVSSCVGCNGLGFGVTGESGGYMHLVSPVKWILIADMLLGRLELFTFLVLLLPSFWRR